MRNYEPLSTAIDRMAGGSLVRDWSTRRLDVRLEALGRLLQVLAADVHVAVEGGGHAGVPDDRLDHLEVEPRGPHLRRSRVPAFVYQVRRTLTSKCERPPGEGRALQELPVWRQVTNPNDHILSARAAGPIQGAIELCTAVQTFG
jgi:hypothetical protein